MNVDRSQHWHVDRWWTRGDDGRAFWFNQWNGAWVPWDFRDPQVPAPPPEVFPELAPEDPDPSKLSGSSFVLLNPSGIVGLAYRPGVGYRPPCHAVELSRTHLATMLMAWAIWELADRGAVQLALPGGGQFTNSLAVVPTGPPPGELYGLQAGLARQLHSGALDLHSLVTGWFRQPQVDPERVVIDLVFQELRNWEDSMRRGMCEAAQQPEVQQRLTDLTSRWQLFVRARPAERQRLLAGASWAIRSMKQVGRTPTPDQSWDRDWYLYGTGDGIDETSGRFLGTEGGP